MYYEILKQNKDRRNKFTLNIINVNDDNVLSLLFHAHL